MRQRAGLTQQELAGRIGVGCKTISKWEQGRGIPDISLLYSLSLELDVDIESLLAGNLDDIGKEWIGIIHIGMTTQPYLEEREWQCMVSMFLLAGIRDIVVLCMNADIEKPTRLLQEYCDRGFLRETYCTNFIEDLEQYVRLGKNHICLLYQPAFLYGMNLTRYMRRAMLGREIRVLALRQGEASPFPKLCFDSHFSCIGSGESVDSEWHMFPMLFGGSMEINVYLEQMQKGLQVNKEKDVLLKCCSSASVEAMERGMMAFSFQTREERELAKRVLGGIEKSQNIRIGDLKEIMKVRGWK